LDVEIPMFPNETPAIPSGASTTPSHLAREAFFSPYRIISHLTWFRVDKPLKPWPHSFSLHFLSRH